MRYIKTYEMQKEDFKAGDTVYCINNFIPMPSLPSDFVYDEDDSQSHLRSIVLGSKYTIQEVFEEDSKLLLKLKENPDQDWSAVRFTKDRNHPVLKKIREKTFDL